MGPKPSGVGRIALGIDRLAMLLLGLDNIRDVIPFPKTQSMVCLMTGAPGTVTEKQLKELHVRVVDVPSWHSSGPVPWGLEGQNRPPTAADFGVPRMRGSP